MPDVARMGAEQRAVAVPVFAEGKDNASRKTSEKNANRTPTVR